MKNKFQFILAIVLGAVAFMLLRSYIKGIKRSAYQEMGLSEVVVSKTNLPEGTVLNETVLAKRAVPKEFLPEDVIKAGEYNLILGQETKLAIKKGKPMLWSHLGVEERKSFSSGIPEKRRALTIGVDELTGVGGMILPHDHVDIIATVYSSSGETSEAKIKTITLLQDITVLAVGRKIADYENTLSGKSYSSVTLSVNPLEAQLLVHVQERGRIYLSLRNPEDREIQETSEIKTLP